MAIVIPSSLRCYTGQKHEVEADGTTLAEGLSDLDRRYSGLRFRIITEQDTIRPHIKIFINDDQMRIWATPIRPEDHTHIICALSGG